MPGKQHIKNDEQDLLTLIDDLRQVVQDLQDYLDVTKIKNIFTNKLFLIGDSDTKTMKISASYILVHQIVFYRLLASHEKYSNVIPPLNKESIASTEDLDELFFKKVKHVAGDVMHVFNVSLGASVQDVRVLREAISSINSMAPERIQGDYLGKVFHQLMPTDLRKKVASYYTLEEGALLLASLAIRDHD
nr:hypothetical protein [Candidatus Sigynarchaeota archaeon]